MTWIIPSPSIHYLTLGIISLALMRWDGSDGDTGCSLIWSFPLSSYDGFPGRLAKEQAMLRRCLKAGRQK
jgi:hypothetical protein